MNTSVLLLGSNLGDKRKNIYAALNQVLLHCGNIRVQSSFFESEPWGFSSVDNFVNLAVLIETKNSPAILLNKLLKIEKNLGRIREKNNGYISRIIDIDIIFYNNLIINENDLVIPHPLVQERRFALVPITEIVPEWVHPIFKLTSKELLINCPDKSKVTKISSK